MTDPQISISGPTKDGFITVFVGDPKAPLQVLSLPIETWWLIMGTITKNTNTHASH